MGSGSMPKPPAPPPPPPAFEDTTKLDELALKRKSLEASRTGRSALVIPANSPGTGLRIGN